MDTEFDRNVAQTLLAYFLTRGDLYKLGIKPDNALGKLSSVLEASTQEENAIVAADELMNCRLTDWL